MIAVVITRTGQRVTMPFTESDRLFTVDFEGVVSEVPRPSENGSFHLDVDELAPGEGRYPLVFIVTADPLEIRTVTSMTREEGLTMINALLKASLMTLAMRERGNRPLS